MHPMLRDTIERVRTGLDEVREQGRGLLGDVEVREPDPQVLDDLNALVHDQNLSH